MTLGHTNGTKTSFYPASFNVSVVAGSATVIAQDAAAPAGTAPPLFAISFSGVTFTASQFYLYISQNGLGNVNTTAGDIRYAGPFSVSAFTNTLSTASPLTFGGVNFTQGNIGGTNIIEGPIPIHISNSYANIKIYDGACGSNPSFCGGTGIAVAIQDLIVLPGLTITPTTGAAGTPVTFDGGGFPTSTNVFIHYSYTFYAWSSGTPTVKTGSITGNFSTGPGYFTQAATMLDTKQGVGGAEDTTEGPHAFTIITFTAWNGTYPHAPYVTAVATFNETNRGFASILSYDNGFNPVDVSNSWSSGDVYANDTAITTGAGVNALGLPVYAYVFGIIYISGNWSYVSSTINFWLDGVSRGSTASDSSGYFNGTLTVPITNNGLHNVTVGMGNNVNYSFTIWVLPTLVLTPTQGYASYAPGCTDDCNLGTLVTANAYGFPEDIAVYIYWNSTSWNDGTWYNLVNGTTGGDGQFNVTVQFYVPETFGGTHGVTAFDTFPGPTFPQSIYWTGWYCCGIANATFTVLPSVAVIPYSFNNTGSLVQVIAEGLIPVNYYSVNMDNQMADFSTTLVLAGNGTSGSTSTQVICTTKTHTTGNQNTSHIFSPKVTCTTITLTAGGSSGGLTGVHGLVTSNPNGTLWLWFVAAGFRPGMHEVSLTSTPENYTGSQHVYGPEAYGLFWVGTGNDTVYNGLSSQLSALSAAIAGFQSSLNSIQSTVNGIQSSVSSLSTAVSSLASTVNGISSTLTTIQSTLASIQSSLSSIQTAVNDISTTLGSSNVSSQLNDIEDSIAAIQDDLNTVKGNTAGLSALSTQVGDTLSAVNTSQTYVLVVAVLAAITLVLALAILIRKLS